MKSRVISVTINRPFEEVYAFACVPENFMKWASGLASSLHKKDDVWLARTPLGEAVVVFSELNKFGVLDHSVHLPNGQVVEVPLRVIKNGEGADVMLTLFQMPSMTDEEVERDAATVVSDMNTLKSVLEGGTASTKLN